MKYQTHKYFMVIVVVAGLLGMYLLSVSSTGRSVMNDATDNYIGLAAANTKCVDSDVRNYYLKGTVTYLSKTYTDVCKTTTVLTERICLNGKNFDMSYTCPYKCSNGACNNAPPTCTPQWTCLNNNTKAYTQSDCNKINITTCANGCSAGVCIIPVCRDADSDAYGNPLDTKGIPTSGYVSNCNDCNDNNAFINPSAAEKCNGVDDNCNSVIDEGFNISASCGSCGGVNVCSGGIVACSKSTPVNYGQSCGSCGGTITCSGVCSNDTCLPNVLPTCYESDGGINYNLKGSITYNYGTYSSPPNQTVTLSDSCSGNYVNEAICFVDANGVAQFGWNGTNCQYGCSNGACISAPSCTIGWKCLDSNTKAYQLSNCSYSNSSFCNNGCNNGACIVNNTRVNFTYKSFNAVCGDGVVSFFEKCDGNTIGVNMQSIDLAKSSEVGDIRTVNIGGNAYVIQLISVSKMSSTAVISINNQYYTMYMSDPLYISGLYVHMSAIATWYTNNYEYGIITLELMQKITNCHDLNATFTNGTLSCTFNCNYDPSGCT